MIYILKGLYGLESHGKSFQKKIKFPEAHLFFKNVFLKKIDWLCLF